MIKGYTGNLSDMISASVLGFHNVGAGGVMPDGSVSPHTTKSAVRYWQNLLRSYRRVGDMDLVAMAKNMLAKESKNG